jgi:hypothetical protein
MRNAKLMFGLLMMTAMIGCSSQPKDPFTEWGASTKYREYTPPTAKPVAEGMGVLTFTATEAGDLYIRDKSVMVDVGEMKKPKAVAAGYVPAGTEVTFDPANRRVHGKGREGVRLTDVDPTHTYELLFDPKKAKD